MRFNLAFYLLRDAGGGRWLQTTNLSKQLIDQMMKIRVNFILPCWHNVQTYLYFTCLCSIL